jgi:3-vinyl bacteriochlorophyllide hydratase
MYANLRFSRIIDSIDNCPWSATAGRQVPCAAYGLSHLPAQRRNFRPLYNQEERRRRDTSPWTIVQAVLAPVQFAVFLASLALVLHALATGGGTGVATASVVVKTLVLYTIMVTGAIWEHEVFGRYLFARSFFWEDMVSMLVLSLHTAYLAALWTGALDSQGLMLLALVAYATYALNAGQFVLKLRAARLQSDRWQGRSAGALGLS